MISKDIIRNFYIRYHKSMISKRKYVIYTYSGYRFEQGKKKNNPKSIYDIIGNH